MASAMFRELRLAEVGQSIDLLRRFGARSGKLLEIGAGTGWQSKALSEAGYAVEAIDLPADAQISNHARRREWPITDYDGAHIPFPDRAFDIIYSSNVLEHVVELDRLAEEMKRVLKSGGIALHLVPNPQWRLLSLVTYYPGQAVDLLRYLRRRAGKGAEAPPAHAHGPAGREAKTGSLWRKAARRLLPPTHGSVGTPLGEIGRFSRRRWDSFFERMGWDVLHYSNNGLAASGDYLLGSALPLSARRAIGRATGGIAHVYVVRPREPAR